MEFTYEFVRTSPLLGYQELDVLMRTPLKDPPIKHHLLPDHALPLEGRVCLLLDVLD